MLGKMDNSTQQICMGFKRFSPVIFTNIMEKLKPATFVRIMQTAKCVDKLAEESKKDFRILLLDHTLILDDDNTVVVRKGNVNWIHDNDGDAVEIKLKEEHWSSVKFFSFPRIMAECELELYNRFKEFIAGKSIGCTYDHLTLCPFDYLYILRPKQIQVENIDDELYEAVKNMKLDTVFMRVTPLHDTNFDVAPHLAKQLLFEGTTMEHFTAIKLSVNLVKKHLNNSYSGKLRMFAFRSILSFDEMFPKEVKDRAKVWTGDVPKAEGSEETVSVVCALFPDSQKNFVVFSGTEREIYRVDFMVKTGLEVLEHVLVPFGSIRLLPLEKFLMELARKGEIVDTPLHSLE